MPKENTRLKVQLKLAINRLKLNQTKKQGISQVQRKEISVLLSQGKEESARIRVEHIIRDDYAIEAFEIIELYCELLLARFSLLDQQKTCDSSLAEAVNSIIYAAPRCDVKELMVVREMLIQKFGKEFALAAMENQNDVVNPRVPLKAPESTLVNQYLSEIAKSYHVEWEGNVGMLQGDIPSNSDLEELEKELMANRKPSLANNQQKPENVSATHITPSYPQINRAAPSETSSEPFVGGFNPLLLNPSSSTLPPFPSMPPPSELPSYSDEKKSPACDIFPAIPNEDKDEGTDPDFDELTRRFEELKKRK